MRNLQISLMLALAGLSLPAMAYIDPASGSAIMSAIIGFFVAAGMAIKTYWYKIKAFFTGSQAAPAEAAQDGEEETQA